MATPLVERGILVSMSISTLRGVNGFACSMPTRTTTPLISTSPMTTSGLPMGIRVRLLGRKGPLAFTKRVDHVLYIFSWKRIIPCLLPLHFMFYRQILAFKTIELIEVMIGLLLHGIVSHHITFVEKIA